MTTVPSPSTEVTPPVAAADEEELADTRIAEAVERELAADPAVEADLVQVDVDRGVVELRGLVPNLLMADAAIDRAEMVQGVRTVVDVMEVPRSDRADTLIRTDLEEALRVDPATDVDQLTVRVVDGVASLRGNVPSFAQKRLAERVARSVRGVRDVVDQIEVHYPGYRDDAEILSDVHRMLRADRWVDEWLLDAEVGEGVVTLRGQQPTAAAKRRAIEDAWVEGVRGVDATLVDVEPELSPELRHPPASYRYPDDDEIRSFVSEELARDPRLTHHRIGVVVQEGNVTLDGRVGSLAAKEAATEIAQAVRGVWKVDNKLSIRYAATDGELERAATEALARAAAIDEREVTIDVRRGVVTLHGSVESPYSKIVAAEVIERIPGVRSLRNEIEAPPRVARPISDEVLRQNVMAHLASHPYVDASQIEVLVSQGEVMLRGSVDDWRAEREAVRAAYEAGATNVLDDIQITHGPPHPSS